MKDTDNGPSTDREPTLDRIEKLKDIVAALEERARPAASLETSGRLWWSGTDRPGYIEVYFSGLKPVTVKVADLLRLAREVSEASPRGSEQLDGDRADI